MEEDRRRLKNGTVEVHGHRVARVQGVQTIPPPRADATPEGVGRARGRDLKVCGVVHA